MPTARQSFIERIDHLEKSLNVDTLNDHVATDVVHNNIAKLLRNGLAVVGFVAIEDFIKKRTGEVLKEIGTTTVAFGSLPVKLKYSVTVDVLQALSRIVKNEQTLEDEIALIQTEALKISSTANTAYDLTEYAFGYKYSNLNNGEIKNILTAFSIKDGWGNMTSISSRIGLTAFPLNNSFDNAAIRRHKAAHVAHSNTPINDLSQYVSEAYGIAISFDSLITKALIQIKSHNANYLLGNLEIDQSFIKLSFIKYENGVWKYKRENNSRSLRNDSDKASLIAWVIRKAQTNEETLIIYDEANNITDWICY
jgi:hypothetical protein